MVENNFQKRKKNLEKVIVKNQYNITNYYIIRYSITYLLYNYISQKNIKGFEIMILYYILITYNTYSFKNKLEFIQHKLLYKSYI